MSTYHRWLASDPTNNTGCSTPAFKRLGVRPCFFARDLGGRVTIEKLTRKQKGEPTTPTLAEKYRKYKIGKWTCLNNSRRERLANLKFYNLTKREVNKFQIFLLLEIRFSSLCEFQLISTKEPQAQRKRYIYRLYVSTAYVNLYIYINISIRSTNDITENNATTVEFEAETSQQNNDTTVDFEDAHFFLFLICQCELRGERPNVHLPSLVGQ